MGERYGRLLRIIAIILLGLTAAMNLLGGIGTTCVAFTLKGEYADTFSELTSYLWIYQLLVVATVLLGLFGVVMTIHLAKGQEGAFQRSLILLVVGSLMGGIHYAASMILRGAAAPANMKLYINAITLIFFLILNIPGVRKYVDFSRNSSSTDRAAAGGLAAIVAGLVVQSVPHWAAPSHSIQETNWVLVLQRPLEITSFLLFLGGAALLVWAAALSGHQEIEKARLREKVSTKLARPGNFGLLIVAGGKQTNK